MAFQDVGSKSHRAKKRLSQSDSAAAVGCLNRWLQANKATSVYAAALFFGVSRATLGRWIKGGVRIPLESGIKVLEAMIEYEKRDPEAEKAIAELASLLTQKPSPNDRLFDEFRRHRIRFQRTMKAITAAGFCLVPMDDEEESSSNGLPT